MKLTQEDAALFWELMTELQLFANQEKNVVPGAESMESFADFSQEERLKIRDALFARPDLIETFVRKNPKKLPPDKLSIVAKWTHFVRGSFFIERYLKAYAVFIQDDKVFAVHGLVNEIDEVIPRRVLPYYTEAVLLPFKGIIVYDGVLMGHNISFGGGVKRRIRETYMIAKQNNRIITSLEPESERPKAKASVKPIKDFAPQFDELIKKAKKLPSGSNQPPVYGPAFSLIRSSIELGQAAVKDSDDTPALWQHYKKVVRSINKLYTVLKRADL